MAVPRTRCVALGFTLALATSALSAAAHAQNLVEPLSNGMQLSWTKPDIVEKFGPPTKPTWDDGTFGYDGFGFQTGGRHKEVWMMSIDRPGITLASGIGVGSSKSDVQRVFGKAIQATTGQYKLTFGYNGDVVSSIKIEPANDRFVPVTGAGQQSARSAQSGSPASTGAPHAAGSGIDSRQLLGTWYGANVAAQIDINANGTYTSPNGARGRWSVQGDNIVFTGPLASWNNGRATLTDGNIEFRWNTPAGAKQYFVLIRR